MIEKDPNRMIPSVIHFIFGLGDAPEQFIFCWYIAVLSAKLVNQPERILFHFHHEPFGWWWERTKTIAGLQLKFHPSVPTSIGRKPLKKRAHRADVLRLQILLRYGGVYMDIDTISVHPCASLFGNHEFVIGIQAPENPPRGRLCNAIMMAIPGSTFVRTWLDEFESCFEPNGWGEASVDLPHKLYEHLGSKACTVVPTAAFLWPPWYKVREIFEGDSTVPDELITLHLWAKISAPFLETITGFDWMQSNPNTLYGQLLQRVLALFKGNMIQEVMSSSIPYVFDPVD